MDIGIIKFNEKIKGSIFLLRHFIFTTIPILCISYLELSQTELLKWVFALPFMYLMAVNDYNRLFTLFKNPLPIFMILAFGSMICALFPVKMFYISLLLLLFRVVIAFDIIKIINLKNMNSITERQKIIIVSSGFFIIYLAFYENVEFTFSFERWLGNIAEFLGSHFVLTIGLIARAFKKINLNGIFIGQAIVTAVYYLSFILESSLAI